MPHSSFSDIDITSSIVAGIAGIWGSILSFMRREKSEYSVVKFIYTFFLDLIANVGITLLTYMGLIGYGVNELVAVSVSGFMAYQGTRGIHLVELIIADKAGSKSMLDEVKRKGNK